MNDIGSLRFRISSFRNETGSVTAETAISITFLIVAVVVAINVLLFAIQYQRLLTLAQESSRAAASLSEPYLLETQIKKFISNIDSDIKVEFSWQPEKVKVTLIQPTKSLVSLLHKELEADATAPRWTN